MNQFKHSILMPLILSLSAAFAHARDNQQAGVKLTAREPWTTVFGGERIKLHFDLTSFDSDRDIGLWSYAAGERRLAAGELSISSEAGGRGTIELPLRIPPVKDGIIFETKLTVSVVRNGEVMMTVSKPITIYPSDPFAGRKTWLEELDISLYDPDGKTADLFEESGIPYHRLGTLASIGNVEEGILVVGEGLSLNVQRGLFDLLPEAASRGVPVLCLASTEGDFPLPFTAESDLPNPDRVLMDRHAAITRFDKRFDAKAWGARGDPVLAALQIARTRTGIAAEIADADTGWPWLELSYGESSVLVWCGFGVIQRWEDSPTPRYLLIRIFEHLTDTEPQTVPDDKPRSYP